MKEMYDMVLAYMQKWDHPMFPDKEVDIHFRLSMLQEEFGELAHAIMTPTEREDKMLCSTKEEKRQQIIEEYVDLLYLMCGDWIALGIDWFEIEEAFKQKHAINLSRGCRHGSGDSTR